MGTDEKNQLLVPVRPGAGYKEASAARMDVLGCDLGTAETGACSAAPAEEAETPTQSGSGGRARAVGHAGWLERGPARCSRVRVPGGAALNCCGGGVAETASSELADAVMGLKPTIFTTVAEGYFSKNNQIGQVRRNTWVMLGA